MPTIGVAIAIPEPWARELQDYRTSIGDATAAQIPTHVTLVPPTEIPGEAMGRVEHHLRAAAASRPAYRMHLRGTGTFRPVSPVVFVQVARGISETEVLADAVRRGPLDVELKFAFHPHVTVAHHLDDDALDRAFGELADFECTFEVEKFHLYVHDEAVGWQPTSEFELRPAN